MIWLAVIVAVAATISTPGCGDNTAVHTLLVFAPLALIVSGIVLMLAETPRKIGGWPLVIVLGLFFTFVAFVSTAGSCMG